MKNVATLLDSMVSAALRKTAVTITDKAASAYNADIMEHLLGGYCITPVSEGNTPSQTIDKISKENLEAMASKVKSKAESFDKNLLERIIDATQQACSISKLVLIHDPNFGMSQYASYNNIDEILAAERLIAPAYMKPPGDEAHTFVYCAMKPADIQKESSTYFKIRDWERKYLSGSIAAVTFGDNCVAVGGNHLPAAWRIATIQQALSHLPNNATTWDDKRLQQYVVQAAYESIYELCIPRELPLAGHVLVLDGVEQLIKPNRKSPKITPTDITPTDGNVHLNREDRSLD